MPIKHIAKRKGSYVLAVRYLAHNFEDMGLLPLPESKDALAHSLFCGLVEALYDVHPLDVADDIMSVLSDKRKRRKRKEGKPGGSPPSLGEGYRSVLDRTKRPSVKL